VSGTVPPALSDYSFTQSAPSYSNVAANQTAQYAATITTGTTVWVEDALPAGAPVGVARVGTG
jgi:hypothetical protein